MNSLAALFAAALPSSLTAAQAAVPPRLALAYSGGLDSSVLLHLAAQLAAQRGWHVLALHIHHGLSPNADAWQQHCAQQCAALGVPFFSRRIQLQNWQDGELGGGLEEAARLQRYAALGQLCREQQAAYLLTAHHQDDQAETLLLHMLRGSGVAGLGGMEEAHAAPTLLGQTAQQTPIMLARPLLQSTRAELEEYARQHGLSHIDDESNADPRYARNALRHQVMPQLAQRFPGFQTRLARTAQHMQAAQRLLQQLAAQDLQLCRVLNDSEESSANDAVLHLPSLLQLDADRRDNLLRYWLALHGKRMPSTSWLREMWQQLQTDDIEAHPCIIHPDCQIRLYRQRVYLTPRYDLQAWPQPPQDFRWQGETRLRFDAFHGSLLIEAALPGQDGICADWLRAQTLQLHYRRGAEKLKIAANRSTRSLKQHYQAQHVPPWQRQYLPLLSCGGQLLFAPQLGMACQFFGAPDQERVRLAWLPDLSD